MRLFKRLDFVLLMMLRVATFVYSSLACLLQVFLLSNPSVPANSSARLTTRDPLVMSVSRDGFAFDRGWIVASCASPPLSGSPGQPNGCVARNHVGGGAPGPQ
jgi:hypothetical protein